MVTETKNEIRVGTRTIAVTNIDKIYFPRSHITKADVIAYYYKISAYMVPYLKNRPLTMLRYPEGITGEGFYQKDAGDYFPAWIKRVPVKKETGGVTEYVVCNDAATLVYLANQGVLTPHIWASHANALDYPDRMIFDLDPSAKDFSLVQQAAYDIKLLLDAYALPSYIMTTGSRGMHVVVPLKPKYSFEHVRACAKFFAQEMVKQNPGAYTLEMRKNKRGKKVFIDYLRNGFGATAVAPYAIRAIEGAPVATPITWQQALSALMSSQKFTIKNVFAQAKKNPWADFEKNKTILPKKLLRL